MKQRNFSPKRAWRELLKIDSFRSIASLCICVVALFVIVYLGGNSEIDGTVNFGDVIFNEKVWLIILGMVLGWWLKPKYP